ncbi:hypothetical protein [Vibrio splendidus]|uniref:hypothetical protein n=1 Tax=Vibrio splendidus TaxID=29497 RepID=UPI0024693433|nr:hypothetical protein [Vibrio splendidus]MDH5919033.1 hypothetical protein [Vibrio splendidus]
MKEIIQALESRIKSPLSGYFSIAFMLCNWRELFFLLADKGTAIERIEYFTNNTSHETLLWYPLLVSIIYTIAYPWLNLAFLYLCRKPTDLRNTLQANSEHKLLVEKNKLESLRSEYLATAEKSLIDQAKRDLEIERIEDESIKQNVQSSIDSLRNTSPSSLVESEVKFKPNDLNELFAIADRYRQRAMDANSPFESDKWIERAEEIEQKAHKIAVSTNA